MLDKSNHDMIFTLLDSNKKDKVKEVIPWLLKIECHF